MYSPRFNYIVAKTLNFEKGYQNYANDTANYTKKGKLVGTNRGISAIAYEQYLGKEPTVAMMKAITPEIAKAVYYKSYWQPMQGDKLRSDGVAWVIFDSFIATGNLGTVTKGINALFGYNKLPYKPYALSSVDTVNQADSTSVIKKVIEANINQRKTGTSQAQQRDFLDGWINRLNTLKNEALNLAFHTNLKLGDIVGNRVRLKKGISLLNYWKYSSYIGDVKKTVTVNPSTTQNHVSWDERYPWKVVDKISKGGKLYIKIKYLLNYNDVLSGKAKRYTDAWFAADRFELF